MREAMKRDRSLNLEVRPALITEDWEGRERMFDPEVLHGLKEMGWAAIGLFSIFGLGWWFGFRQGLRQQEKAMMDAVLTGTGFMQDGKRIDPKKVFKGA